MKVIFLDIDGVLNTSKTFIKIENEYKETGVRRLEIDLDRVELLKEIVDNTGALIVLSSSWRVFVKHVDNKCIPLNKSLNDLFYILNKFGLYIYDITPQHDSGIRQNEINSWLEGKSVERFIVIDDDPCVLRDFVNINLIKTSFFDDNEMIMNKDDCSGLCKYHVEQAINYLNNNKILRLKKLD